MKAFWFSCIVTVVLIALRVGEVWEAPYWLIAWLSPAGLVCSLGVLMLGFIAMIGMAAAVKVLAHLK